MSMLSRRITDELFQVLNLSIRMSILGLLSTAISKKKTHFDRLESIQ